MRVMKILCKNHEGHKYYCHFAHLDIGKPVLIWGIDRDADEQMQFRIPMYSPTTAKRALLKIDL